MRTPKARWSNTVLQRIGITLIRRLKPDAALGGVLETFEAAHQSLEQRVQAWEGARRKVSDSIVLRQDADTALDHQVRALALKILTMTNNNREADVYQKYFPDGYGRLTHASQSVTLDRAAGLVAALQEESDADLQAFREPIETARGALEAAVASVQAAGDGVAEASALLNKEKVQWCTAFERAYLEVRVAKVEDPRQVEALFDFPWPRRSRRSGDEEADLLPAVSSAPEPAADSGGDF